MNIQFRGEKEIRAIIVCGIVGTIRNTRALNATRRDFSSDGDEKPREIPSFHCFPNDVHTGSFQHVVFPTPPTQRKGQASASYALRYTGDSSTYPLNCILQGGKKFHVDENVHYAYVIVSHPPRRRYNDCILPREFSLLPLSSITLLPDLQINFLLPATLGVRGIT